MKKTIKSKYIDNNLHWKYLVDKETWEIEEINIISKKEFISIKTKPFMRIFDNKQLKQEVYKILWDYTKYILLLTDYIDYWNIINFALFQKDYWVNDVLLSRIRKRLIEVNIIVKDSKIWYLNPVIAFKWTEINIELWNLFKDKNLKLYWIKTI